MASEEIKGKLRIVRWATDDAIACLQAFCPACDFEHGFNVDIEGHGKWTAGSPVWGFDGNYDSPTFDGSMLSNKDKVEEHHPLCHSWLKNGVWDYLGDCTHDMVGQEVDLLAPDPDHSFQRQHGWHLYPFYEGPI